jgi:signal transduction histidine kinase
VNGYLPEVIDKDLPLRIIALSTAISGLLFVVAYHKFALFESRRRMALLEAEQERYLVQQELTQNLAHDLRTPISILKTKMYLIKRYAEKDMPIASKLDELETVANNMNVMIEDLLALTLLDKDMVMATGTSILVEDMVSECIESLRSYATTYNIRITLESSSPRSVAIYGNRKQLIRAFTNLIENAVHYGKVDGYVNICLHNYADHVTICVEDDGIGIAPENHEKVFDRFFRVNPARTSDGRQGTGIGLSIVQKIIEAHGGKISLESELGHGTKFMVSLPRHAETA